MKTPEYTYTPDGGMTQTFTSAEKRDAYAAWHQSLGQMVEQERQRMANEQARKDQSARTMAEVALLMGLENEDVNGRLR